MQESEIKRLHEEMRASAPEKDGVEHQVTLVEKRIDILDSVIGVLEGRLSPVLLMPCTGPKTEDATPTAPRPQRSPVSERVIQLERAMLQATHRLDLLINRLDL